MAGLLWSGASGFQLRPISLIASTPSRLAACDHRLRSAVRVPPRRAELVMQGDPERGLTDATSSSTAASLNLAKAIVGAGSFSLPYVCKKQGVVGGLGTIVVCAVLASYTMQSLIESKDEVEKRTGLAPLSYVDTARLTLGQNAATLVFTLTAMASLLVCSSYLAFIGSTLATMAAQEGNIITNLVPSGTSKEVFEVAVAAVLLPICCLRDFRFLSFTSVLGIVAVVMACATVLFDGLSAQGSLDKSIQALQSLPLGPASVTSDFESFGTVVYLFCVNFLIFPIQQNMARGKEWPVSVQQAVTATAACNAVFAALGYSFFGDETQEIILNNLGPGELLSAVKLLLCVDLLCSYPLVLVSGRDIVEKLILGDGTQALTQNRDSATEGEDNHDEVCATEAGGRQGSLGNMFASSQLLASGPQVAIRTGLVAGTCLLAQAKGFGIITNVAGGFAQGTLAFILPGALALSLKSETLTRPETAAVKALIAFGFFSASVTTYLALAS